MENNREKTGQVFLVGAGPGDEMLITRKGFELLKKCDVLVYDSLASEKLLSYGKPECEKIYVGKRSGKHSMKQEEINEILVKSAGEGSMVVRLKGGDPFVFGRGGEEVLALQKAGIPYEVVPGVTSAIAALTSAGIPVTHREVSRDFHVITGHTSAGLSMDFETCARLSGTLVFLMGLQNMGIICRGLMAHGMNGNTPAAVIQNGTMPQQKVVKSTLEKLEEDAGEQKIGSPAIIVVGETVRFSMESTIAPSDTSGKDLSLKGVRAGITGTESFGDRLKTALESHGAEAEIICSMKVISYEETPAVISAVKGVGEYQWLVFTSANGVRIFMEKVKKERVDYRVFASVKFAVIGKGTEAELRKYGFSADYMPDSYYAAALAEGLLKRLKPGERALIPRAEEGSRALTDILQEGGASIHDLPLYQIEAGEKHMPSSLDYLIFASGSGVRGFFRQMTEKEKMILNQGKVLCIGRITAEVLEKLGRKADIVAEECSVDGILEAIKKDRYHT